MLENSLIAFPGSFYLTKPDLTYPNQEPSQYTVRNNVSGNLATRPYNLRWRWRTMLVNGINSVIQNSCWFDS